MSVRHHRSRGPWAYALGMLTVLALTACGSSGTDPGGSQTVSPTAASSSPTMSMSGTDAPGSTATADAAFNEADITFLQGMIPHHQQAVVMAEMVDGRTDRMELVELADTIIATQSAEVQVMNELLEAAGAEPMEAMEGMDMSGMQMPGTMGQAEMDEMMTLEGDEFAAMFIESMTMHHQGAIQMSEEVLAEGENPEVAALAQDIIAAQEQEIEQMQDWKQEWGL